MNKQKPWPVHDNGDGSLNVHSIFHTIQGEGPFSGVPATFIRLAGCNLQCPLCDTEYTGSSTIYTPRELVAAVAQPLVVITGGEPFRQDLHDALTALFVAGHDVQIETNGSIFHGAIPPGLPLTIVCSPKTPRLHPQLLPHITHFKYVLETGFIDHKDGLPTRVLGLPFDKPIARPPADFPKQNIFVHGADMNQTAELSSVYQELVPKWNSENIRAAVDSAVHHGYRFGLQVHKLIDMP